MYSKLSNEELKKMMEVNRKNISDLQSKIREKEDLIKLLGDTIHSRDVWNTNDVVNKMLSQLEEMKDQISENAYTIIENELRAVLHPGRYNKISNAYRKYSYSGLVSNIYIDFGQIVMLRLSKVTRRIKKVKYVVNYEFDFTNRIIETSITSNVFTIGKSAKVNFSIPNEDVKEISKLFNQTFKFKIEDYTEIIPKLVKSINSLEDGQINAVIFGYYLANV